MQTWPPILKKHSHRDHINTSQFSSWRTQHCSQKSRYFQECLPGTCRRGGLLIVALDLWCSCLMKSFFERVRGRRSDENLLKNVWTVYPSIYELVKEQEISSAYVLRSFKPSWDRVPTDQHSTHFKNCIPR